MDMGGILGAGGGWGKRIDIDHAIRVHPICTFNAGTSVPTREVSATEFKIRCLRIIQEMGRSGRPVTITRRGRPVALLSPLPRRDAPPFVGMLAGTVLRFDDPLAPAATPEDWLALR